MTILPFTRASTATASSTATNSSDISVVKKLKGWRPRFFMLMAIFIAASSVTVGVLGWKLTFNAAKDNIEDLVQQIEDLISNRISAYILDQSDGMSDFVALQQDMFRENIFSASTPTRKNRTLQSMLMLLNRNRRTSVDIFFVTYPAGEISGYTYNATGSLQMWTQQGMTVTTWNCDDAGVPIGNPYSISTNIGDGTPKNPGNNNLLDNDTGISVAHVWNGRLFKTTVGIAVNKITGEKVVVGGGEFK
ncbi:hypothetical protein HDU79_005753 [Rhizoclosmatium sp. JEL0117]|nr:hypothetical protein HDU79_005753 [Rhizoclosmatium sp. JEL0117]